MLLSPHFDFINKANTEFKKNRAEEHLKRQILSK